MKNLSPALPLLACCLLALGASPARAQSLQSAASRHDISIELDASNARALLALLGRTKVTDEEVLNILQLPSTQALIRQTARFDPSATEENFKSSLRRVAETGTSEHDPFRFAVVKARLEPVRSLLKEIEGSRQRFVSDVIARVREYAPDDVTLKSRVHFILGGTSDGFAPDSDAFYIALHYYGDDSEGLKTLMAHELLHNVQAALRGARQGGGRGPDAPAHISNSLTLLRDTVNEGMASMAGDALLLPGGKQYSDFLKAKYQRNLGRIKSNFALFEALLYRAYNDPAADFEQLRSIGFAGAWDSPLYFVGYRMGKVIEKYEGKAGVRALAGAEPLQFFNLYVELYRKHNDPEAIRFSPSCEEILRKLQRVGAR